MAGQQVNCTSSCPIEPRQIKTQYEIQKKNKPNMHKYHKNIKNTVPFVSNFDKLIRSKDYLNECSDPKLVSLTGRLFYTLVTHSLKRIPDYLYVCIVYRDDFVCSWCTSRKLRPVSFNCESHRFKRAKITKVCIQILSTEASYHIYVSQCQ